MRRPACEITLARSCLAAPGVPPELCGLCRLMGPDGALRYLARWNPPAAEPVDRPVRGRRPWR